MRTDVTRVYRGAGVSVLLKRNSKVMNLRAYVRAGTFIPLPVCASRERLGAREGR